MVKVTKPFYSAAMQAFHSEFCLTDLQKISAVRQNPEQKPWVRG